MTGKVREEWISTGISDLRSTLDCHRINGILSADLPDLRATLAAIANWPGQSTRRKLLESFIRRAASNQQPTTSNQ